MTVPFMINAKAQRNIAEAASDFTFMIDNTAQELYALYHLIFFCYMGVSSLQL